MPNMMNPWIPACAEMSGMTSPHHARAALLRKCRHHFAGETAQAVLRRAAAVKEHIADAERLQAFQFTRDLVGRAVKRALFARFARIRESHDACLALGAVRRVRGGGETPLRFEPAFQR